MDVFYINLASQDGRRRAVEENFQAVQKPGWSLTRVEAVTAADMAGRIAGRIGDGEKACTGSHLKAIALAKARSGHALIAEDDIYFGRRSLETIENTLAKIPEGNWDIIFTDVSITNIHAITDLLLMRRQAINGAPFGLINLARMPFAGSVGYIINRNAMDKLLALIPAHGPLDFPYDIDLQRLVQEGKLRAFVTFPFATTLGPAADVSLLRNPKPHETAMNAFRRLMWLERDIAEAQKTIAQVTQGPQDGETQTFLKILSVFLSPDFKQ